MVTGVSRTEKTHCDLIGAVIVGLLKMRNGDTTAGHYCHDMVGIENDLAKRFLISVSNGSFVQ